MSSFFDKVSEAPPDAIFGLNNQFAADQSKEKLNIVVGAYRTEEGKPYVLNSVKKAEAIILNSGEYNKEYLPIDGLQAFNKAAAQLLFGKPLIDSLGKKLVTVQTLSGTGSLRLAGDFIKKFLPNGTTVYISDPTWANHKNIFTTAGLAIKNYRYYDLKTNSLDFSGFIEDLKNAPDASVILLHACAHNPTGLDPTPQQWESICNIIKEKRHVTLFDCAYQGFATGDLDRDAQAIRMFVEKGLELFVCQSFAKNTGLYGERVGTLNVVCSNDKAATNVLSQLKTLIRANYSNPPGHGAYIVSLLLNRKELFDEWVSELKLMSGRIDQMRTMLHQALKDKGVNMDHLKTQIGMFSYTGLTSSQVELMKSKFHIYLTSDGRVSLPGLSTKTVHYLANSIVDVKQESKL